MEEENNVTDPRPESRKHRRRRHSRRRHRNEGETMDMNHTVGAGEGEGVDNPAYSARPDESNVSLTSPRINVDGDPEPERRSRTRSSSWVSVDSTTPVTKTTGLGSSPRQVETPSVERPRRVSLFDSARRTATASGRRPSTTSQTALRLIAGHEDATSKFISETFFHRECKRFIEDKNSVCKCGYHKNVHAPEAVKGYHVREGETWAVPTHTDRVMTNAFGDVDFYGFGRQMTVPSPYVRVDHSTDNESIWKLLTKYWHLPVPNLIISVTGGNKNFQLKKRMLESFKRGLIQAASSTGAWIITTGMNSGVVKYVGEAVKDHVMTASTESTITCLGISPWGYIDNKETLISKVRGKGLSPAQYNIQDCVPNAKINLKKKAPLDPHHTHFIMVDNGLNETYGVEKQLRAGLEQYVATKMETSVGENQTINVPIVRLVLEGGLNTLESTAEAIKNNTPVVVFQGSGRTADIVAYCYAITKSKTNEDLTIYNEDITEKIDEKIVGFLELTKVEPTPERVNECRGWIKSCLADRRLLSVYELSDGDQDEAIEKAILNALLKVNKHNASTQLRLALAWDRCDIARYEIFTPEKRDLWKDIPISDYFFTALVQDRADFVQLFLDVGVELRKCLTFERLHHLYERSLLVRNSSTFVLKSLLKKAEPSVIGGKLLACTCGSKGEVCPDEFDPMLRICGKVIMELVGFQCPNFYEGCHTSLENPERDLFLWATLLNRKDLAALFWRSGKEHIGSALVGSSILKSLMNVAKSAEEMDYHSQLQEHAKEFEEKAIGVLMECFNKEPKLAHLALTRQLSLWGQTTALTVASVSGHREFMGHSAPQSLLNRIWKGEMALFTSSTVIFLTAIVPFFMPLIKFTKRDTAVTQMRRPDPNASPKKEPLKQGQARPSISQAVETTDINPCDAIKAFYTAPITKFVHTCISYVIFLGLFSYFVLTDLYPIGSSNAPSIIECIVWAWAFILILEEIRQVFANDSRSAWYSVKEWFSSTWNRFDVGMYSLLLLTVILRLFLPAESFFWARDSYAITLSMFYLRFIQVFYVHKNLGPKVIMIQRMIMDLLFFIVLVVVFIMSYGVATQALLFPNAAPEWLLLKKVLYSPYWQIFSDPEIDLAEGRTDATCSYNRTVWLNDPNIVQCPEKTWVAPVYLVAYILLTNVLLINLLIAMFSYTFQVVQDNAELVWRFNRYSLIYEYYDRPELAPPLSIILLIYRLLRFVINKAKNKPMPSTDFRESLISDEDLKITAFEKYCMEHYLVSQKKRDAEELGSKLTDTGETVNEVKKKIEDIQEHIRDGVREETNKQGDFQGHDVKKLQNQLTQLSDVVNHRLASQELKISKMMTMMEQMTRVVTDQNIRL